MVPTNLPTHLEVVLGNIPLAWDLSFATEVFAVKVLLCVRTWVVWCVMGWSWDPAATHLA